MEQTDVIISGGGIAGMVAAAALAHAGFDVICLDPAPPVTERDAKGADLRTTAFLQPAAALLGQIGVWERLAPEAAALQVMRIVDIGDGTAASRVVRDFDAADVSEQPFGWNLPNWLLRRELMAHLEAHTRVSLRMGTGTAAVLTREREVRVTTTAATSLKARLLVGADGRGSPVRRAVGIDVRTTRYGQKAVTFAVTHPIPHQNVSTEIHRSGGPFTLVPLPDRDGQPCSAVVWMEQGAEAQRLAGLEVADFEAEMTGRSGALFGPLKLVSRRTVWPIIAQIAGRLSAQRTALIAEAAHVVPPIGAQGLNMSLNDIRTLMDLAQATPDALGETAMLDLYHRQRYRDISLRVTGIDLLNRTSMASSAPMRALRAKGLDAIYALAPVRRMLMQMGLGIRA